MRVLLYFLYTIITGWRVLLRQIQGGMRFLGARRRAFLCQMLGLGGESTGKPKGKRTAH